MLVEGGRFSVCFSHLSTLEQKVSGPWDGGAKITTYSLLSPKTINPKVQPQVGDHRWPMACDLGVKF
jgi:hypothetical protein